RASRRTGADADDVPLREKDGRDRHAPSADSDVSVADGLSRLSASLGQASSEHGIIEAGLKKREKFLRGRFRAQGLIHVAPELLFGKAIAEASFLFFNKLLAVIALCARPALAGSLFAGKRKGVLLALSLLENRSA